VKEGRRAAIQGESLYAIRFMPLHLVGTTADARAPRIDVVSVHEEHADFVCLTLQRFGVREVDIEDQLQEVFVVVHRRLHTFDGASKMRTWLFGICMRVSAGYRKRAFRRHERSGADGRTGGDLLETVATTEASPEEAVLANEQRERLVLVLDSMDLEARGLFVMFEIDEVPCDEIAEMLGVPTGTVYSRLHAARKVFQAAVARLEARKVTEGAARRMRQGGAR